MTTATTATAQPGTRASARERLLAAANELFYAEGVQTVGIDRIIDRAGVARGSLYNVFGSKEELVAAYLASRHEARPAGSRRPSTGMTIRARRSWPSSTPRPSCSSSPTSTAAPSSPRPPRLAPVASSNTPLTNSGHGSGPCSPVSPRRPAPRIRSASADSSIFSMTARDWPRAWTIATRDRPADTRGRRGTARCRTRGSSQIDGTRQVGSGGHRCLRIAPHD